MKLEVYSGNTSLQVYDWLHVDLCHLHLALQYALLHSCMFGYILVCLVACIILVGLISNIIRSCLAICVYEYM